MKPTHQGLVLQARDASARALEFPTLLTMVAELAATDLGRDAILDRIPFPSLEDYHRHVEIYGEVKALLAEGTLVHSVERAMRPLLASFTRMGVTTTGRDLLDLADYLNHSERLVRRLRHSEHHSRLKELSTGLVSLEGLITKTRESLDSRGEVRDDASPLLVELRGRISRERNDLYERLGTIAGQHRDRLADDTIPMRGGRLVLTIPTGAKGELPGLVHGRSGSGKSFYLEPLEVVDGNNRLQHATAEEEAERRRIMAELLEGFEASAPEIRDHANFLTRVDVLQALCWWADRAEGRLVELGAKTLHLNQARHPLIDPRLSGLREEALGSPSRGDKVVPLDLHLDEENRILVVTGPNAGGKTVVLKTAGLTVLAARFGIPMPVGPGSTVPFVDRVFASVGDEQDILTEKSTFSGRLLRLKEVWDEAGENALVLFDELGAGTDPEEGSALAIAFLEGLLDRRVLGVMTTHLIALASKALEGRGALCASMEYDPETGEPRYRIQLGPPGGSRALDLAYRLGLDPKLLGRAGELLGTEAQNLRRLLAEVEKQRESLQNQEDQLVREIEDAEALTRRLAVSEEALRQEKKKLAGRMKSELETFRRDVREKLRKKIEKLPATVSGASRRTLGGRITQELWEDAPKVKLPQEEEGSLEIREGSRVKHRLLGWVGQVEVLKGEKATVLVSGKRLRCQLKELLGLESLDKSKKSATRVSVGSAAGTVASELNLIGLRVEEALERVEGYLDQALVAQVSSVRIVHGHGTGRLRRGVREYLKKYAAISSFRPGKSNEGGDGATVVVF